MTCRCRDLRRSLLGLVRAARAEQRSADSVALKAPDASYQDRATALDGLCVADKRLRRSLRRARRLLRETRPEKQPGALSRSRCASIGPAPTNFRCALPAGHDGDHSALTPTGGPWWRGDIAESEGWKCCCCDLPVLRPDGPCPKRSPERYSREATRIKEHLDRIMAAWLEHNRVTFPYASSDSGLALHEALSSVARELGYSGGEDGGAE